MNFKNSSGKKHWNQKIEINGWSENRAFSLGYEIIAFTQIKWNKHVSIDKLPYEVQFLRGSPYLSFLLHPGIGIKKTSIVMQTKP